MNKSGRCLTAAVIIWMSKVYTEGAAVGFERLTPETKSITASTTDRNTTWPPFTSTTGTNGISISHVVLDNATISSASTIKTTYMYTAPISSSNTATTTKNVITSPPSWLEDGRPWRPSIRPAVEPSTRPAVKPPIRPAVKPSTRPDLSKTAIPCQDMFKKSPNTEEPHNTGLSTDYTMTSTAQSPCYKLKSTTTRSSIFDKVPGGLPPASSPRAGYTWLSYLTMKHLSTSVMSDIQKQIMNHTRDFNISGMAEDVIERMVIGIARLPINTADKLFRDGGLVNMTALELASIPAEIIAYQTKTMATLNMSFTPNQTVGLCQALAHFSPSPKYLYESLQNGIECDMLFNRLNTTVKIRTPQAVTLLNKIKEHDQPAEWNQEKFTDIIEYLGNALMQKDIESVPDSVVNKCLNSITHSGILTKSTRRSLAKRLMKQYTSPTTWSNSFLVSMAPLLEDIDLDELKLLRNDAVLMVANDLTKANIRKDTTRIVLAKSMFRTMTAAPTPEVIRKVLPWLKSDFTFMKNLDLDNLLEALRDIEEEFGMSETYMIAERLENHDNFKMAVQTMNSTNMLKIFGRLFEGFSLSYLDDLPMETLKEILSFVKPISSRVKARHIHRKMFDAGLDLSGEHACIFLNGMTLEEIDQIEDLDLLACMMNRKYMTYIKHMDLPDYIGRKLINKLLPLLFTRRVKSVDGLIHLFGKHTRHVNTAFLRESNMYPLDQDIAKLENTYMTKPQLYAVMDNVWRQLYIENATNPVIMSELVRRLGVYVLGLTAEDISHFTTDSDFLSVIEMMSSYENQLGSSQVRAIVAKLREYLQIADRNVLDDVDEVIILQIGRFLQYLNSNYELVKFPKYLRPLIAQEIGKSSLMRITNGKRRALLKFALENAKADNGGELKDIYTQSSIDADVLLDLGSLKCGLTHNMIYKLTAEAIKVHMDDLQKCPFKQEEMSAVAVRALYYNRNILISREHLAAMGHLMLELTDEDLNLIDNDELAAIPEYIVKSIHDHDVRTETIKKNGFIREHKVQDEQARTRKLKRLSKALRTSMENTFGSSAECQIVFRLQHTNMDISELLEPAKLQRCIEYIGDLKWDPITAKQLFNRLGDLLHILGIRAEDTNERVEFLLNYAPNLLPGLPAEMFNTMNLTDDDIVATVGEVEMLTDEQLETGFNRWSELRKLAEVSGDQLAKLKYLACGASAEYIRSRVDASSLRTSLETLGEVVRKCNEEQLKAYAEKVATALGGTSDSWFLGDLVEMGSLLGGLNEEHLSSLTEWQIKAIEPEVITNMPNEKIREFTIDQLRNMTVNQVKATTLMQRSYLSEDQVEAIGIIHYTFNGAITPLASCYVTLAVVLSIVRQVFVFVFW